MAHSKALSVTDSRSSGVVSLKECGMLTKRLEDLHKQLTTFPGLTTSVVALKGRLQSFSETLQHRLQREEGLLLRVEKEGWTLTERTVALNKASTQFSASHSDATSFIIVVEGEIERCQKELDISRNDLDTLRKEIEQAGREANRLREHIDSLIEHWREEERRHDKRADAHKGVAIGVGVTGLVLAPFTFGLSALLAAPAAATGASVLHMEMTKRFEERKEEHQRELREKEELKSACMSKIADLSTQCSRKEDDIGKLTGMTELLTEIKTFLLQVASSFDNGRKTIAAMVEEMESIRRGTQTLQTNSKRGQGDHLSSVVQDKRDDLVRFIKGLSLRHLNFHTLTSTDGHGASDKIDVMIVTATTTEFVAVKRVLEGAAGTAATRHPILVNGEKVMPCVAVSWKPTADSPPVTVGATLQTEMGETGTIDIGMALKLAMQSGAISESGFVAMVGVCAGRPSKVNLGDVLVPWTISTIAGRQRGGGTFEPNAKQADIPHKVQIAVQDAMPEFGSGYKWLTNFVPDQVRNAPSPRLLLDATLNELNKTNGELHFRRVRKYLLESYSSWSKKVITLKVIREALLNLNKAKYAKAVDEKKRIFKITDCGKRRVMDITKDCDEFPRPDSSTPKIFNDPVVTGNIVNTDMDEAAWQEIEKKVGLRKVVGYEMEGYWFLEEAATWCSSMGRLFVKAVSDTATDEYKMDNKYYQGKCAAVAAAFLLHVLAINPYLTGK